MCAKYYENPTMLSKVTAKNVGDVFLRHTVYCLPVCLYVSGLCLWALFSDLNKMMMMMINQTNFKKQLWS